MGQSFFDQPILNSPYEAPTRHHALDKDGQPLDLPPVEGRRRSEFITPVPKPRKRKPRSEQQALDLDEIGDGVEKQKYNPTPIINEMRSHVASWRALPSPADWSVTPTTARLLQHWRHHQFEMVRPFFCQLEAVETAIWLTEVARNQGRYAKFWEHIRGANEEANPELLRIALKMATGSGKTTVMAMLIAWQTLNAVRSPTSNLFSRGFLIVTPGITIKDRLRVLMPDDAQSYYRERELVPSDMLGDLGKAKIVITNFHAFKHRETLEISKTGRSLLQGRGEAPKTLETDGQMLQRACGELMALKNVVVLNDEAHHCYREVQRPDETVDEQDSLKGEDKDEAKKNNEAARLWISGIEALQRKIGVRGVYDLSATPFFLRGSGYAEGTLFPWTVSDFSLMDAIECGIVKLPRVPVSDNMPGGEVPMYRDLWSHVGARLPKKGRAKSGNLDPLSLPSELQTALYALYGHYEKTFEQWKGLDTPPVFIVVCNNTSTSQLVYEWISGWDRGEDEARRNVHRGHLGLFRNYDERGNRLARPKTLLIDSEQLESGEALDAQFRDMAEAEIEQFRLEKAQREGAAEAEKITDQELLREVMNTVGKKDKLGEQIRCVVSVAMLTEGWDANTVTHILGIRAFGTQLLCEQVVGRALRRQSYELNEHGLFDVEYADIMGIPFDFTAKPVVVMPKPPKPTVRVHAIKERAGLEIQFPRVEGYRVELQDERIAARFTADHRLVLTPELVGPCKVLMEGIVGQGVELNMQFFDSMRANTVAFHLARHLLYTRFRDPNEEPPLHLFGQIQRVARQWLDGGYLVCSGGTKPGQLLYREIVEMSAQLIYMACQREEGGNRRIKAILDAYNPKGSTRHVSFTTSKDLYKTSPAKCHVNYVVCDSDWEAELARVLESHPKVRAYAKNHGMQFEIPYLLGSACRKYIPDFVVQVDDGHDDPLNLVLETKGYRRIDAQIKAETMKTLWVPGVNNLGTFGRWAFEEFTDVFEIEAAFGRLMDRVARAKEMV